MKRLITLFITLFSSIMMAAVPINKVVIFGDSISDNGNVYQYSKERFPKSPPFPSSPPYFPGHFSNGIIWAEYFTQSLFPTDAKDHLLDFAYGGAGIVPESEDDGEVFTLNWEIERFLEAHEDVASPDNLYVIWIGANNYLLYASEENQIPPVEEVALVKSGIKKGIQKLISKGANRFLIIGLPDLGQSPAAGLISKEKELKLLCDLHNQSVKEIVAELKKEYSLQKFMYYDVHSLVNKILKTPKLFGFKNVSDTCYDIDVDDISHIKQMVAPRMHQNRVSDHCEGFLFFDPVHPTTIAHNFVSKHIEMQMRKAGWLQ